MPSWSKKLSFVIPAYNEEHYIGRCLDAIYREIGARDDIEVIVADNNSTDRTVEIVSRYPGVKLVRGMRRGANSAREAGFRASHGEFVAFPDADTDMPHGWIARMEQEFKKNPELICISGPFDYYDLPPFILLLVRFFYYTGYMIYLFSTVFFRKTTIIQGGNYVVRRWALEKIGGQNVDLIFYGDDTDLALRLSKIGKVKFSLDIPTRSSGRRLAKEGAFTMGLRYGLNNLWITIFHRPFTSASKEIRFEKNETIYAPENKIKEFAIAMLALIILFAVLGAIGYLLYRLAA